MACANSNSWAVAWTQSDVLGGGIAGCQVTEEGKCINAMWIEKDLSDFPSHSDIGGSIANDQYLVVYVKSNLATLREIGGKIFNANNGTVSDEFTIGNSWYHSRRNPSVNQRGYNFFVAWEKHDLNTVGPEGVSEIGIEGVYVTHNGDIPEDDPITLSFEDGKNLDPSVASRDDNINEFAIVWSHEHDDSYDVHYAVTSSSSKIRSDYVTGSVYIEYRPSVTYTGIDNYYLVAYGKAPDWEGDWDICAKWLNTDGDVPLGDEDIAATDVNEGSPEGTTIAGSDGEVIAVWDRRDGFDVNLYAREWYLNEPSSITVTSPKGGENWRVGTSKNIKWTSTNVSNVKIEYSTNNGSSWAPVILSTDASAGSFSWTVPETPSSNCLVKITDTSDATVTDKSDNCFTISIAGATTLLVPSQYSTIQEAIDAASNGETIEVEEGIYYGCININGKAITLTSENPDDTEIVENTIIDGNEEGSVIVVEGEETNETVITGFTIQNGATEGFDKNGGGIRCMNSNPTITKNRIINNYTQGYGGGIYAGSETIIEKNTIYNNSSMRNGGGIYGGYLIQSNSICRNSCSDNYGGGGISSGAYIKDNIICDNSHEGVEDCSAIIENNVISGNGWRGYAVFAGGIDCSASIMIRNNIITGNCGYVGSNWEGAGAILCWGGSNPAIVNNVICGNTGNSSGGIVCGRSSSPLIMNNIISGNYAYGAGGISCFDGSSPTVTNNTVSDNMSGGWASLYCGPSEYYDPSLPIITNCIFWGNWDEYWDAYGGSARDLENCSATYSCTEGGAGVGTNGNIGPEQGCDDPRFVGGPSGNWSQGATANYDSLTYQTTFTDPSSPWVGMNLTGKLLRPNMSNVYQYFIISNTASTITVWGDALTDRWGYAPTGMGNSYQVYDYHLIINSTCKDTGDPSILDSDDTRSDMGAYGGPGTDKSDLPVTQPPSITIVSPNGGEDWTTLSSHDITWTSTNIYTVKIEYSTNSGEDWTTITESVNALPGTYSWEVSESASTDCLVRIIDTGHSDVMDQSDETFTTFTYIASPEPPSNLQAFETPNDQGHSITLKWSKSPDDGAGLNHVSYYRIYRSRSSEFTDPIPISSFPWSACADTFEFSPGSCPALDSLIVMELDHTILIDSVAAGITEYVDFFVPVNGVGYYYWLDAVAANGAISAKIVARFIQTDVGEEAAVSLPEQYFLYQNSPNPFNAATGIRYQLPQLSDVRLVVYDIIGRRVRTLVNDSRLPGSHSVLWNGKDQDGRPVGSGIYLYRLEAGDFVETRRMLLLR